MGVKGVRLPQENAVLQRTEMCEWPSVRETGKEYAPWEGSGEGARLLGPGRLRQAVEGWPGVRGAGAGKAAPGRQAERGQGEQGGANER